MANYWSALDKTRLSRRNLEEASGDDGKMTRATKRSSG